MFKGCVVAATVKNIYKLFKRYLCQHLNKHFNFEKCFKQICIENPLYGKKI